MDAPDTGGLVARKLACVRGGRTVFSGLDLDLARGELLILTGPNGCGKTSLLRIIAGFLPPAAGTLEIDGEATDRSRPAGIVQYIGHELALKSTLDVASNLAFWRDSLGGGPNDMATAITTFDLAPLLALRAGSLSQGQRKRLSLARLLLAERPLWLLDEPTAAIDAAAEKRLDAAINRHLAHGGSAIIATHHALGLIGRSLDLSTFTHAPGDAARDEDFAA